MYEVETRSGTVHKVRADSEAHAIERVREAFGDLHVWGAKVREVGTVPTWRTRKQSKDLTGALR